MAFGLVSIALPSAAATSSPTNVPSGYGHDLSCVMDLDPAMLEVDGLTCLAQALARRITTPRGTLLDDANYGFDVRQFLNDDLSPAQLGQIGGGVDAEFLKDERVLRSSTQVSLLLGVLTVASTVTPNSGATFQLVIGVSSVTTQILQPGP